MCDLDRKCVRDEGLLIVCMGNATKCVEKMKRMTKEYSGTMKLGEITASYDASEPIAARRPWEHITGLSLFLRRVRMGDRSCVLRLADDQIKQATTEFKGHIKQRPPMFSAVRVNGVRLHELARKGVTADRYDVTDGHTSRQTSVVTKCVMM